MYITYQYIENSNYTMYINIYRIMYNTIYYIIYNSLSANDQAFRVKVCLQQELTKLESSDICVQFCWGVRNSRGEAWIILGFSRDVRMEAGGALKRRRKVRREKGRVWRIKVE